MQKGGERMWSCEFMAKEAFFLCVLLSLFSLSHAFRQSHWFEHTSFQPNHHSNQGTQKVASDGPGSYPPRCTSKCGDCTPCIPVHVPVPPGTPVTTEYYPETWRCKCGNKLYLP